MWSNDINEDALLVLALIKKFSLQLPPAAVETNAHIRQYYNTTKYGVTITKTIPLAAY